ncbi:flavin reductase family protein [Streptomyces sp. B1I3]|uniref:flavin reductase family protein n=1 Tax=Streptomyces sp. B1I3 TaxID=3042264 RepID=UPI0027837E4A|nr:flavin reductase family protein [Streptomyces sp. B1I3]MDQ0793023.1 flavin reductase (DIM6/NTAB) family NADH-FMN oxidoreductase RutF [Streptomyces sp. B1I3]
MNMPDGGVRTAPRPIDPRALRSCMGQFATGVTVITCRRGDVVHGTTVNAFTSVSLDPPLALVALDRRSRAGALLLEDGGYVINILDETQRDLAMHFAGRPMADPVPWVDESGPHPRLAGAVAHLVCRPWQVHDGGDHTLHIGRVEEFESRPGRPLLFHRGAFPELAQDESDGAWSLCLDGMDPVEHFHARDETRD